MSRLAVRCDPQTDVAADEVERWLQREVERFRYVSPRAFVRLHRLSATESTLKTVMLEHSDALPFADSLHASGEPV